MTFTELRPDGSTEVRQHVPYTLYGAGGLTVAKDARTGRILGRFPCQAIAERVLNSMTEGGNP